MCVVIIGLNRIVKMKNLLYKKFTQSLHCIDLNWSPMHNMGVKSRIIFISCLLLENVPYRSEKFSANFYQNERNSNQNSSEKNDDFSVMKWFSQLNGLNCRPSNWKNSWEFYKDGDNSMKFRWTSPKNWMKFSLYLVKVIRNVWLK